MRTDAVQLEETRLQDVDIIAAYPSFHERHRVFPAVFESRQHQRILDIAAGVGCAAQRIQAHYPADLVCNDISPKCLDVLGQLGLQTTSFNIDGGEQKFPFPDGRFDAVIALATIEHVIHVDHFVQEIHRILSDDGHFYVSAPNYTGLLYLSSFLLSGRTFHDPLSEDSRYEFYAHVRYFTYRTLLEYVSSFGFIPDTVYLALPAGSSRYQALYARSRLKALTFRCGMWLMYKLLSPRWASEPILCFQKGCSQAAPNRHLRKVVL